MEPCIRPGMPVDAALHMSSKESFETFEQSRARASWFTGGNPKQSRGYELPKCSALSIGPHLHIHATNASKSSATNRESCGRPDAAFLILGVHTATGLFFLSNLLARNGWPGKKSRMYCPVFLSGFSAWYPFMYSLSPQRHMSFGYCRQKHI